MYMHTHTCVTMYLSLTIVFGADVYTNRLFVQFEIFFIPIPYANRTIYLDFYPSPTRNNTENTRFISWTTLQTMYYRTRA